MNRQEILNSTAMPAVSPSYPAGPYKFYNREYFIISYLTDKDALLEQIPEPLTLQGEPIVHYEWIRMPDSPGFGDYTESGVVIPCMFEGEPVNFVSQMFLDDFSPIAAGREIWGVPKEYAEVSMKVVKNVLTGTMDYAEQRVAIGTMLYKEFEMDINHVEKSLAKTQVLLKLIPNVDGTPAIAQLVALNLTNIKVKGAWQGRARLRLIPNAHTDVAELPVLKVLSGSHYIADLTFPYGRVVYDYLKV